MEPLGAWEPSVERRLRSPSRWAEGQPPVVAAVPTPDAPGGEGILLGRVDLLVEHPDGAVSVLDFKAGSHFAQVSEDGGADIPGLSACACSTALGRPSRRRGALCEPCGSSPCAAAASCSGIDWSGLKAPLPPVVVVEVTMSTTAPPRPVAGMQVWVQWGSRWCHGTGYRIARVTGRTFTVAARGGMLRRPLVEWPAWLAERFAEGRVCLDCVWLTSPDPWGARDDMDIDVTARERRLAKAVREVAKSYRITEAPGGRFTVRGGQRDYEVGVHRDWSAPATCTCPDAVHGGADAAGGYCKHVIAVLLQEPDLRCQLLDVLL